MNIFKLMVLEQQQPWTKIRGDESGRAKDQGICENVWTVIFNYMELYGMFDQLACIKLKVHSNLIRAMIILHPISRPELRPSYLGAVALRFV